MTVTTLFIGDPHFQINNLPDIELFIPKISNLISSKDPDFVVVAGDLLHTHERLHTTVLNKAYDFIDSIRKLKKTYILVGNHDYISNTQFLSENHWMNSMKEWDNVEIIDKVKLEEIGGCLFTFVPYVYPGRFKEALSTVGLDKCLDSTCIFAHQEFKGCKMGAIISEDGDVWGEKDPYVVSGHIHSKQSPQSNVYYPGTPMQIAFGESENNIVPLISFSPGDKRHVVEEFKLDLPCKKIVYMDVDNIGEFNDDIGTDKIRITLSGNYDQFKAVKKTKKYKDIIGKGVKVVFKPDKEDASEKMKTDIKTSDFSKILLDIVNDQRNPYLLQAYDKIINNRETKTEDIFFL